MIQFCSATICKWKFDPSIFFFKPCGTQTSSFWVSSLNANAL